jgi:hypothetical protein
MEDYLAAQALTRVSGRKYAQSEASEKISEASSVPREELEDVDGPAKEVRRHPESRTQTLQALGVVRGYCAMTTAEKDEEDGKKALAYSSATTMTVHGFGEKDIHLVRVILATKGYCTLDMRYIASMGLPVPGDKKYHPDDWGSNDGKSKNKTEY